MTPISISAVLVRAGFLFLCFGIAILTAPSARELSLQTVLYAVSLFGCAIFALIAIEYKRRNGRWIAGRFFRYAGAYMVLLIVYSIAPVRELFFPYFIATLIAVFGVSAAVLVTKEREGS